MNNGFKHCILYNNASIRFLSDILRVLMFLMFFLFLSSIKVGSILNLERERIVRGPEHFNKFICERASQQFNTRYGTHIIFRFVSISSICQVSQSVTSWVQGQIYKIYKSQYHPIPSNTIPSNNSSVLDTGPTTTPKWVQKQTVTNSE